MGEVKAMGFLDKLKEQASSLSGQLDQALDGTKQKGQVGSMRKQRGELVAQLGESILEQFRQEQINAELLRPQVNQIFELEREIIQVEQQIEAQKEAAAQAKAAQTPPPAPTQAAATPPPPAAPQAPPPPPAAPAETSASVCASCGTEIPSGSAFCPNCGEKAAG
jgi:hypothetical protein